VLFPIVAVGHHNCDPGLPWSEQFARLFPGAFHYEELNDEEAEDWTAFKRWEREAVRGYEVPGNPGRSLARSSIMLAQLPAGPRPVSLLRGLGATRVQAEAMKVYLRWQAQRAAIMRGRS
jgi:hypothetical protein